MSEALIKYDAMCRAIAEAHQIDEVKGIRDKATALEVYARQAKNVEAEQQACEIRLRAERRWGQLYRASEKAKAGRPSNNPLDDTRDYRGAATLADMGVSYQQSSDWQKIAGLSDEEFEAGLVGDRPTTAGLVEAAKPPTITPVSHEALWLWGRLNDFRRDGILEREPTEFLATMTPTMRKETLALAPLVAAWLARIGGSSDV